MRCGKYNYPMAQSTPVGKGKQRARLPVYKLQLVQERNRLPVVVHLHRPLRFGGRQRRDGVNAIISARQDQKSRAFRLRQEEGTTEMNLFCGQVDNL